MNLFLIISLLFFINPNPYQEASLAFPGAEGFGKHTTGGRGGKVMIVTNLNDDGPGSLREAIQTEGKRTILFNVSGNIELESSLVVENGDLTIAGHSAPGGGITIQNYPVKLKGNNLIIRYIRVRVGDLAKKEVDAISGTKMKNVIIDHCSFSWGNDEVASFYDNQNFTLQWCIISEGLQYSYHSYGKPHGYGGIWGGKGASFHHNLMAHLFARLPRFNGSRYHHKPDKEIVDFRNNVLYNWVNYSSYGGEEGNQNLVNNYYKYGPATEAEQQFRILRVMEPKGKFYISGNYIFKDPEGTKDNWVGGNWKGPVRGSELAKAKVNKPFPSSSISTQSAEEAFESVLENSGANIFRDDVDKRIIEEVRNGNFHFGNSGIINSQSDVGGWPELTNSSPPKDSDGDGIPDDWEIKNGLDPTNPEDSSQISPDSHYSYIEIYLEELIHPQS